MHSFFYSRRRRFSGTTLVEILVVIVVFLVGILAIAQIFPGGLKILARTRNSSMALALARSQIEAYKARPDLLPEQILPISYVNNLGVYTPVDDSTRLPNEYAPPSTAVEQDGTATDAGRPWQLVSGANAVRRIIGETHTIPAPRLLSPNASVVTAPFGSLVTLELGPMDHNAGVPVVDTSGNSRLQVYGRDMYRREIRGATDLQGIRDYEFGTNALESAAAQIVFPARFDGRYRVSATFYVDVAGTTVRRHVNSAIVNIVTNPATYVSVPFSTIPGVLNPGESLIGVEANSLRVAQLYTQIALTDAFDITRPYTYKVINARIGQLLFNRALFGKYEERAGAKRQSVVARIDYDVRDWRILHEDFRVTQSFPAGLSKVIKLAIPSLKTNSVNGADAQTAPSHAQVIGGQDRPNASMEDVFIVNNTQVANANTVVADNFLVVDIETGGQLVEQNAGRPTFQINKNTGNLTLFDVDSDDTTGLTQIVALHDGTTQQVNVTGRTLRVYYMGKDEWAVQTTRNPARYNLTYGLPGAGQFYVGGTDATLGGLQTRIYFPRMDANRRVSIGRIRYIAGGVERTLLGSDFQVRFNSGDTITSTLPSIDIRDVDPTATAIEAQSPSAASTAFSVDDVRGVSMICKVFFNNATFALTPNTATNLTTGFNQWAREWNVTSKETYLHRGESIQ
jgi:type II secretory pathway pseudopilin PulG